MTINYNVTGTERKRLADYISGFMGTEKKYLGAPTFAYQIGYLTVSKDGAVSFEDRGYNSDIDALMAELEGQGFHTEDTIAKADTTEAEANSGGDAAQPDEAQAGTEPESAPAEEGITQPHGFGLTVTLPAASLPSEALDNLTSLLAAKGRLIRKALGVEALPVEVSPDTVSFPWFEGRDLDADEVKTYTHLIAALCDMARSQKRITAKEKATDNDKYAFRCFLLRLGFIGAEFKDERKILLRNLSGNSAFKSGSGKEVADHAVSAYDALQQEKQDVSAQIALCAAKRVQVGAFLAELEKRKTPLTKFDPLVWQATLNYMKVHPDCTVTFVFRDGTEVSLPIEPGVRQYKKRKGTGGNSDGE